jgi:hypothetical protein
MLGLIIALISIGTILVVAMIIYYVYTILEFTSGAYWNATKKEFLKDLIPFSTVFRNIKEHWNSLK